MAHVFQTFTRDGRPHPRWRYQFTNWQGRRRTATGTESESDTRRKAAAVEAEHYEIRKGFRPAPNSAQRHARDPIAAVMNEYLSWGASQGGKAGRPWSAVHAAMRKRHLAWWKSELRLEALSDLNAALPRVEHSLRTLQAADAAGKTLQNTAESLKAFCAWCVHRNYLDHNPLTGLAAFDTTPRTVRRALTFEEAAKLMAAAPPHRALLYRVAFVTGLRYNELRSLAIDDLDDMNCGLRLHAEWTKNRKPGFQRLSPELVKDLREFASRGEAGKLYKRFYNRKDTKILLPASPLLYLPRYASRDIGKDLAAAGIEQRAFAGKVDFHACRTTFATLIDQGGATAKETQTAVRHMNPELTMGTYVKVRCDRMMELASMIDKRLQASTKQAEQQTTAKAVGAEYLSGTSTYDELKLVEMKGFEPSTSRVRF